MLIFILTLSVGFNQIKAIEISKELPQPKSRSLVGYLNGNVHRHGHTHGHGHHANHIETNPAVKALEIQDALRENGTVEANGRVCINKVMMTYETQYDEVMTCDHQYSQQCHETYTTVYEPHQEQECDEKFNKICTIEYEDIANNVEVEECKATFITDCNCEDRPTECRTVYDTECSTLQKVHEVEDDITNCTTVYEKKCEPVVLGLKTEEKCDSWPVEKCTLNKQLVKKYTPETKCEKVPREVCAPEGCCIKEGPLNCQNRVKAVVSSKPLELCDLEPIKQCRHVTKLVPQLKAITECTNVPKEICATSKINPTRIARPAIQKWCYTPDSPTTQFTPTPEPKCTTHDDCDDGYVCKEDECIIGCRGNSECDSNEYCRDFECHAVPGYVLLTEVMFSTQGCTDDNVDNCFNSIIAASLFGQSSKDNPAGIQCEFSGNIADHLEDDRIVFNDQNSLKDCWEAPLNAEVKNNGQVTVINSPKPDAWTLGKMCVGWDNKDKLIQLCDLTRVFDDDQEKYAMTCVESAEVNCSAAIDKFYADAGPAEK